MTTDDKIEDEKLQHDIKREATKTSAFLSSKIDKYALQLKECYLLMRVES